jgi:hypothetical protein
MLKAAAFATFLLRVLVVVLRVAVSFATCAFATFTLAGVARVEVFLAPRPEAPVTVEAALRPVDAAGVTLSA